jgi:hypothetical protein
MKGFKVQNIYPLFLNLGSHKCLKTSPNFLFGFEEGRI